MAVADLGRLRRNVAEGMGFCPPDCNNLRQLNEFRSNRNRGSNLASVDRLHSYPVISQQGSFQQGQNRDKNRAASSAFRWLPFTLLLGLAVNYTDFLDPGDDPLPRAKRRRRRRKEEQGLGTDEELAKLAEEYLVRARELWPEAVKAGLLPEPDAARVRDMAAEFKHRHLTGELAPEALQRYLDCKLELAANYPRFSDPNSDPKSIVDQMLLALGRAKEQEYFIPWELVVADYARSATHGHRQGFETLLTFIKREDLPFKALFIDDFHRGSRSRPEWWTLAAICKKVKLRVVGVCDGFHLEGDDWELRLSIYTGLSAMETRNKQQRVRRGMGGAARSNHSLGKPPLGYTRRVKRNAQGEVVRKPSGLPKYERCFDPATKPIALRVFELFIVQKWTPYRIMRQYNREEIEGWSGWTEGSIRDILTNPAYIGLFIWNRTRTEIDPETQKKVILPNPRKEWRIYYDESLALIPREWHREARNKLVRNKRKKRNGTGRKSPTTLFSGTLTCPDCQEPLILFRSAGASKSMYCKNGQHDMRGCTLSSSKSVKIIEECLLPFLQRQLLTETRFADLVARAKRHVASESKKPTIDAKPLRLRAAALEKEIDKYVTRVGKTDDDDLCAAYDAKIKKCQRELSEVRSALWAADRRNAPPPPPLTAQRVAEYLADSRAILNQDVAAAAEAIRELTGPIYISQQAYADGRRGAQWIARFSPNLLRLLRYVARQNEYPDSITLEFLSDGNWIPSEEIEVVIDAVPKYARLAPEFKRLRDGGASVNSIAAAHGLTWDYVTQALRFADTGQRPAWGARSKRPRGAANPAKYTKYADLVVRLRTVEKMTFAQIAAYIEQHHHERLGPSTVGRAYDHGRPEDVRDCVAQGQWVRRGEPVQARKIDRAPIQKLLAKRPPMTHREIAAAAGCSMTTVARVRRELLDKRPGRPAPKKTS